MKLSDFTKYLFPDLSLGLEIGNSSIKAVWFRPRAGGAEVVDSLFIDLSGEQEGIKGALARIVKAERISFPRTQAVITRKGFYEGASLLPPMPEKELGGFLQMNLVEKGGLDLDDPVIDFFISPVKPSVKKQAAITRIVDRGLWQRLIRQLNRSRLSLQGVNYTGLAFENIIPEDERDILLVRIGSDKSTFYLFRNRRLAYVRRQDRLGGDDLTRGMTMELVTPKGRLSLSRQKAEEIKATIGIPDREKYRQTVAGITLDEIWPLMRPWTDKLINAIRDSIAQYKRNFSPATITRVYLTGGGAIMPGLCQHLDANISEKVKILPLPEDITFRSDSVRKKFSTHQNRFLLALGSGRCRPGKNNLLSLKNRIMSKLIIPFRLLWIILPLAAITFVGMGVISASRTDILLAEKAELSRRFASLRSFQGRRDDIKRLEAEINRARTLTVTPLRYPLLWPGILWETAEAAPPNLLLNRMEMEHRGNRGVIFLKGTIVKSPGGRAKNPEDILNLFIRKLLTSPFFSEVKDRKLVKIPGEPGAEFSFHLYLQRSSGR